MFYFGVLILYFLLIFLQIQVEFTQVRGLVVLDCVILQIIL